MPKVVTAGARPGRLRAGPPKDRDALEPSATEVLRAAVQPGRGPDLRESRVQPGRGPDLRGDLDAEAAPPHTLNRLRPGPPKDREAEDTRLQFGLIAQPAANPAAVANREERRKSQVLMAQATAEASDSMAKAQAEAERGAPGFAEARMAELDLREREVIQAVRPELHATIARDFAELKAEIAAEAQDYELRRRIEAIREDVDDALASYSESIARKPASFGLAMQRMERMVRESELRPDLIESELARVRGRLFESYRQARLAGPNPEALLREMEAGRFEGIVPPEEMKALVAQTTAEVGQRQRAALMEWQVDADTRKRLELQRLHAGGEGDPLITPEELREIFPGEVGERKARHLEFERRRAEVRAQTALMTPAEIEAAFGVFESDSATREDRPDDTLAGGRGDETLSGSAESDRLERGEGADTLAGEANDAKPDTDPQESEESAASALSVDREKSPEERGIEDNRLSFEEDPVGHVLKYSDACRAATQAAEQATVYGEQVRLNEKAIDLCMAEQESIRGTSEGSRALSDEKLETTLAELDALPMLQRVELLWNFSVSQGRHAGRVLDELIQAGVPDAMGVAAHLWITGRTVEAEALRQALAKPENEHRRNMLGTEASQISDGVRRESEELRAAFGENGLSREGDARLKAAELIAWQLFQDGKGNVEAVVARALAAVFPFQRIGGDDVVLLPVGPENGLRSRLNPDRVSNFLIWIRRSVRAGDVDVSQAGLRNDMPFHLDKEQLAEQYTNNIRGHGYWRNTCDGVQLLDQLGRPVVRKDGSFLTVTWAEIEAWEGGATHVRAAVTGEGL